MVVFAGECFDATDGVVKTAVPFNSSRSISLLREVN